MITEYQAILASGERVRGSAVEGPADPFVVFGEDNPIPLKAHGGHVRNLDAVGDIAAWKAQSGGCYWVNRRQRIVNYAGIAYGDEAVALTPSGVLAVIRSQTQYTIGNGVFNLPANRIGTSQGIVSVDDSGHIVFGDDQLYAPLTEKTRGGFIFSKWVEIGGWRVGPTNKGLIAWHYATAKAFIVTRANTPWLPKCQIVNGKLIVATSLPALLISEDEFEPWTEQAYVDPDPPCSVPEFAVPNHPIRIHVFGGPGFNLQVGKDDDKSIQPWGTWVSLNGRYEAEELANVKLGLPTFAFTDSASYSFTRLEQLLSKLGNTVIPTLQVYPLGHLDVIGRSALEVAKHGRFALCLAAYRGLTGAPLRQSWSLADAIARLYVGWQIACAYPQVTDVFLFHQNRADGKDGIVSRPEFIEIEKRMKAAAAAFRPKPVSRFPRARTFTHA